MFSHYVPRMGKDTMIMRKAGILMPLASLPSPHGVGTLGRAAYDFVDFLALSGQTLWQMLPVGPTGYGDSPYQSFSAFAGNPYFIDLDILVDDDLLKKSEVRGNWGGTPAQVDYGLLFDKRFAVLAKAVARQDKTDPEYRAFCQHNQDWLDDYALYMAIKEAQGHVRFTQWPMALRLREPEAMQAAMAQWGSRYEFWRCVQYLFFRQWRALKTYANYQGVQLVGDIPIYVSPDSSDLWAHPELFLVGQGGELQVVAGVPKDAFSPTGQLWGNPLYDWPAHKRTGYRWWIWRLRHMEEMFDVIRIDHFRGFEDYYEIPADEETALYGTWRKGPGKDFVQAIKKALPELPIIAEDLGFLTEEVRELLRYSGYAGMKVLQFAFDSRDENDYLPHNYPRHTVVYTGTHDNTTTEDWQYTAAPTDVQFARKYLGLGPNQSLTEGMIRAALSSVGDTTVIPMQDWLHLGGDARINTPSTLGGRNWQWRLLPEQITPKLAYHLREQTALYGRLQPNEATESERVFIELKDGAGLVVPKNKVEEHLAQKGLPVLTASEMKMAEAKAVEGGTSYEQLMENAGTAAARSILGLAEENGWKHSALLLCGKGNNGGDAFVVARLLAKNGWQVQCLPLCGSEYSELAALNLQRLPKEARMVSARAADFGAAVLVDGIFGTGFRGGLPPAVATVLQKANEAKGARVALDVPSGLNCDTGDADEDTFRAEYTLTFGAYKPALRMPGAAQYYGQVECLDIGL